MLITLSNSSRSRAFAPTRMAMVTAQASIRRLASTHAVTVKTTVRAVQTASPVKPVKPVKPSKPADSAEKEKKSKKVINGITKKGTAKINPLAKDISVVWSPLVAPVIAKNDIWTPPAGIWLPHKSDVTNKAYLAAFRTMWLSDSTCLSIYTDGACFRSDNGDYWAAAGFCSSKMQHKSLERLPDQNSVMAEALALLEAIRSLNAEVLGSGNGHTEARKIAVFTDCTASLFSLRTVRQQTKPAYLRIILDCRAELTKAAKAGKSVYVSYVPRGVSEIWQPQSLSAHALCHQAWRNREKLGPNTGIST